MIPILLALLWLLGGSQTAEWQQEVHYTIEASLDEEREVLSGAASLVYHNRSPDALDHLELQLHLNAFRPNSEWARTERRPDYDFQSLTEPDFGYERLLSARIDARELVASYPHSPDSTVVHLALPDPLPSGETVTVGLVWEARPSTLCRRQCRDGRSYDFAQWYPRIAPYDADGWQGHPLYPQGEFYGEYGTYDVTLDVAEDQVIGATGVPIDGDPGWSPIASSPLSAPLYQRDWYDDPLDAVTPGHFDGGPGEGRKRVRWYAEDVHHFAWSTSPDYMYEGGSVDVEPGRTVAIHALFRPGDEEQWGDGIALERTAGALHFLGDVFRPYPYAQLTNLHRLEGGGTEFPMVIMDGSASAGLIMHETAHQYVHGILGNNEWKEAWLDEGFSSFLSTWAFEGSDPDSWSRQRSGNARREQSLGEHPIATKSEDFVDFGTYGYMAYSRPQFIYYMLREYLGQETLRDILHTYYDRFEFRHVRPADFIGVAEEVSGEDLRWFFDQWWYGTATLDYELGDVTTEERDAGGWITTVEVLRNGDGWMPVTLQVGDQFLKLDSHDARFVLEVRTDEKPDAVTLDPDGVLLDANPRNDSKTP